MSTAPDEPPGDPGAEAAPTAPAPAAEPPAPEPPVREIVLPRGCNPLTFGVVMATLEMGIILWLLGRCR